MRRICDECKESYTPDPNEIPPDFKMDKNDQISKGRGCRECRQTGYRGRVGIYELLAISDKTREMVMDKANARQIAAAAEEAGDLYSLRDASFYKVKAGVTTISEALRATQL